jgi:hypothetical protein
MTLEVLFILYVVKENGKQEFICQGVNFRFEIDYVANCRF